MNEVSVLAKLKEEVRRCEEKLKKYDQKKNRPNTNADIRPKDQNVNSNIKKRVEERSYKRNSVKTILSSNKLLIGDLNSETKCQGPHDDDAQDIIVINDENEECSDFLDIIESHKVRTKKSVSKLRLKTRNNESPSLTGNALGSNYFKPKIDGDKNENEHHIKEKLILDSLDECDSLSTKFHKCDSDLIVIAEKTEELRSCDIFPKFPDSVEHLIIDFKLLDSDYGAIKLKRVKNVKAINTPLTKPSLEVMRAKCLPKPSPLEIIKTSNVINISDNQKTSSSEESVSLLKVKRKSKSQEQYQERKSSNSLRLSSEGQESKNLGSENMFSSSSSYESQSSKADKNSEVYTSETDFSTDVTVPDSELEKYDVEQENIPFRFESCIKFGTDQDITQITASSVAIINCDKRKVTSLILSTQKNIMAYTSVGGHPWKRVGIWNLKNENVIDIICISEQKSIAFVAIVQNEEAVFLKIHTTSVHGRGRRVCKTICSGEFGEDRNSAILCLKESDVSILAACRNADGTRILKFDVNHNFSSPIESAFDSISTYIHSLCIVDNHPDALLGINNDRVYLWNRKTCALIKSIDFTPEIYGRTLYCKEEDGLLFFLNEDTERNLCLLAVNPSSGTSSLIVKYGQNSTNNSSKKNIICEDTVLTHSSDGVVLIDIFSNEVIGSLDGQILHAAVDTVSDRVAVIFANKSVHLYCNFGS